MIRLFKRNETDFTHNETVLNDVISSVVEEEANGLYEVVLEYPRNDFAKTLTEGKILKVPTPRGEQLFRIYKPVKDLTRYKIYARHIFYDLLTNFIEAIKPTNKSGSGAINDILSAAQIDQGFTATSDIINMGTAYYVRMNPVQALLGAPNSFLNVWGGELVRNNHTFSMKARGGQDRGYEVRIGKNLVGVEVDTDESDVYTRIYPTVVIDGNTVTTLPEKYVDSPLINSYEYPRIIEERIDLLDEEKELPLADIYKLMRNHCADLFKSGIDKPEVNFKVDFVELSKTEQYKHIQILEQLDLYDTVLIYVPELDVNIQAKVIRYEYDSLGEKYLKMELGSFKENGGSQAKNTINRIDKTINQSLSGLQQAFNKAQDMITGNLGGHVIFRLNAEGKPYEILIMDTEDIQTAKNVIRLNQQGLGFSKSGYNGPFGIAMTIDGHIVADYIDTGTLSGDLIKSGFNTIAAGIRMTSTDLEAIGEDGARVAVKTDGSIVSQASGSDNSQSYLRSGRLYFRDTDGVATLNIGAHPIVGEGKERGSLAVAKAEKMIIGRFEDYLNINTKARVIPYLSLEYAVTQGDDSTGYIKAHKDLSMSGKGVRDVQALSGYELFVRSTFGKLMLGVVEAKKNYNTIEVGYANAKFNGNIEFAPGYEVKTTSDKRLKNIIGKTKTKGLEELRKLNVVDYTWKNGDFEEQIGLIAQDTPFLSTKTSDGNYALLGNKHTMLLTVAMQEMDKELKDTKQELADLKALLQVKGVIE